MNKSKEYYPVRLSADALRAVYNAFMELVPGKERDTMSLFLEVRAEDATWRLDSEDEFFAEYRRGAAAAMLQKSGGRWKFRVHLIEGTFTLVEVECPTRDQVERVFEQLETHARASEVPLPPKKPRPVTIFIGHGRSPAWRDLKDHLHEQHGYHVIAYEIGARAGHAVRDVLEDMLEKSSFALLLLTAEDELADSALRARQNVVHELGLFQGRLGFARAIALVEEGTETFSNIAGIQQIRYSRGSIKETYGDVLATLRREFGPRAG